nr:extracellular solute-binding protein [Marinilactibacillus kalidii]
MLAACASEGEADSATAPESDSESILVYSNSLADGRQEWLDEKATEAGFDMQYVEAGGGEIFNRLLAESSAPQADVTFGMDEAMFFQLNNEDLLVQYEPSWTNEIPAEANIGDQYFHPLVEQRIFMMYNPEFIEGDDIPENWQDLSKNEALQDKYRIPENLTSGTNQKSILSILLQYVDESGDLGIAQEGWDEVEAFLANGYATPESEDQLQNFSDGTVPVTFYFSGGLGNAEEEYDFTGVPVNPDQGVVTMREQIGILNKGDDHDYSKAEEFVDWFGSAEMQAAFVDEFGGQPVNEVAFESASDRITEIAETTTPMDIDWNFVQENLNSWMEKVELELMP